MTRTDRLLATMLLIGFSVGVVVAISTGAFAERPAVRLPADDPAPSAPAVTEAALPAAQDPDRHSPVVQAVERVAPAVVSITTEVSIQSPFPWMGSQKASSEGSGVVIDPAGVVLTNAHVVSQASRITASFADGATYDATILGIDTDLDLAVLKLADASGLVAVPIGSSADLMLGEPVIAIGNPYGLGHTVTTGVVSTVRRAVETRERVSQDFIQTDASINPGNSGGPLLDIHGRLIGINTAIYAEAQGIGFAIPSDRAMKIARDLIQFGSVQAPWLGVDLDDVTQRGASRDATAARVVRVYAGSSAEAAGLQADDLIVAVDGRAVQGRSDINAFLATYAPGRDVRLSLSHGGAQREVTVQAAALPPDAASRSLREVLGVEVGPVPADTVTRLGLRGGAMVTAVTPGGALGQRGVRVGDLLVAFNGQPINSADDLNQLLLRAKSGHRPSALFTVRRGNAMGRLSAPI